MSGNIVDLNVLILYLWLIIVIGFIIWRVLTHPNSRIHQAILKGDVESVRKCLEQGLAADTSIGNFVTPICLASSHGYLEIVELLVAYGANADQGLNQEDGVNPLLEAALKDHTAVVESLISHGAQAGLHFAAFQGDIALVRSLIDQGKLVHSKRNRGLSPLHLASAAGHRAVVELLLDHQANVHVDSSASETPLHKAIEGNHFEVVELLIERGADLNGIGKVGTPLHLAIYRQRTEIIDLLLARGADVNRKDGRVDAPLHVAAIKGDVITAQKLLSYSAQLDIFTKYGGETPLHYASRHGKLEVAELLLSCGANPNARSFQGLTPLSHARSYPELTLLLLRYGATDTGLAD